MKCLTKVCEKEAISRGLCPNCYQSARLLVKNKVITWEELEAKKMSEHPKNTVRYTSAFRKQLAETK